MATAPNELDDLRSRVSALEDELAERTARANDAVAAAQDRSYWLDRWRVDLNALMRRPGASEAFHGLRSLVRLARRTRAAAEELPGKARAARYELDQERAAAQPHPAERFRRRAGADRLTASPVTDLLHARLEDSDVEAIVAALEPADAAVWEVADATERKRLALAFAAHYRVEPALSRSGLSAEMPPRQVHSMARGSLAAGGSTYYADLVADALAASGFQLEPGQAVLDFGCSSGRVVRVLAAAFPELELHGCDPIPDAIAWARQRLDGIRFERTPEYPPLPYTDGSFDAAFAISIWSHFSQPAGLAWLEEMRRVVRPGGRLLLTTHGMQTIAHTAAEGIRSLEQLEEVQRALYDEGFWYAAEFGEAGDHGVVNPDWGTAFMTAEWLAERVTPAWRIAAFFPGRVEENQDLYVLERR